jgi:hypothetical protein
LGCPAGVTLVIGHANDQDAKHHLHERHENKALLTPYEGVTNHHEINMGFVFLFFFFMALYTPFLETDG